MGDLRVVLAREPNHLCLIHHASPHGRSPPPFRSCSVVAGPSTQSRGPPPPLAVKKARCRGRGGGGWRPNLQGALSAHAGMVRLPRSDSWMQACASSLAPFLILHVQPWTTVYFSSPLPLSSCSDSLASILIEVLHCRMQIQRQRHLSTLPSRSSLNASSPSSVVVGSQVHITTICILLSVGCN